MSGCAKNPMRPLPVTATGYVIAIPARNEAARLPACLLAIGNQQKVPLADLDVLVFANNCSDL
jgi:glycosyltransferase involved in cell wall biosynthesis